MLEVKENPSIGIRICLGESPYLFHYFRKDASFYKWIEALCNMRIKAFKDKHMAIEEDVICFTDMPITRMVKYLDTESSMFSGYAIGFNRDLLIKEFGARPVIYGSQDEELELRKTGLHWRFVNLDVVKNDYTWQHEWRIHNASFDFNAIIEAEISAPLTYPRIIAIAPSLDKLKEDEPLMKDLQFNSPSVRYNCINLDIIRKTESDTMLQLSTIGYKTVVPK